MHFGMLHHQRQYFVMMNASAPCLSVNIVVTDVVNIQHAFTYIDFICTFFDSCLVLLAVCHWLGKWHYEQLWNYRHGFKAARVAFEICVHSRNLCQSDIFIEMNMEFYRPTIILSLIMLSISVLSKQNRSNISFKALCSVQFITLKNHANTQKNTKIFSLK